MSDTKDTEKTSYNSEAFGIKSIQKKLPFDAEETLDARGLKLIEIHNTYHMISQLDFPHSLTMYRRSRYEKKNTYSSTFKDHLSQAERMVL